MKFDITTGDFQNKKSFIIFLRDLANMLEAWDYNTLEVSVETSMIEERKKK